MAILQQYAPQYAAQAPGLLSGLTGSGPSPYDIPQSFTGEGHTPGTGPGTGYAGSSRDAPIATVAPGTPYGGPAPPVAGAYNTLSPNNFAAYKASQQPQDPNWQPPQQQQQLPGLLDSDAAQIAQAKKLFDNPNGYWSGGEGSGGNGGGQR
jgi:hypothetical protein